MHSNEFDYNQHIVLVTGLTSVMILVITNNCAFQSVFYQFTQSLSGTVFTYVVGV